MDGGLTDNLLSLIEFMLDQNVALQKKIDDLEAKLTLGGGIVKESSETFTKD